MTPNIYLFFNGNCFEAMSLYAETLDAKIGMVMRNTDTPDGELGMPGMPADAVMHMDINFDGTTIMASDNSEEMYEKPAGVRLQVEAGSLENFERIFAALSKDGTIDMPPEESFWAERFTLFTDRFGTPWMLIFTGDKMG